ncbi:hypothetical protein FRC03_000968 [Tulasnella sp. 419]|nr:hypothetical protein FRC02_008388 [Tulasnella sp. 418]KAG8965087.1 hypothetical protein FRC03_000968 [Tulasnella sp. 419]
MAAESTGTASSSEHERNPFATHRPLWRADSATLVADSQGNWVSPSNRAATAQGNDSDLGEGPSTSANAASQARVRNRRDPLHISVSSAQQYPGAHNSPTSTMSSSSAGPSSLFRAHAQTSHRLTTPPGSQRLTPKRAINIRSDPMMVTCFDPQDKELYDLWAPK